MDNNTTSQLNSGRKNLLLYMHAGSGNHGCEAIVRSLLEILGEETDMTLVSYRPEEDMKYSLRDRVTITTERSFGKHKLAHIFNYAYRKLTHDEESKIRFRFRDFLDADQFPVAVSIGGDNYCYDNMLDDLELTNSAFNKAGIKTVLLGCSIEPELLEGEGSDRRIRDLSRYSKILTRESVTYEAVCRAFHEHGIETEGKVYLIPDPAFMLPTIMPAATTDCEAKSQAECLSNENINTTSNMVGINISPMIQNNEKISGITLTNYRKLISYILKDTDMSVSLIPHVVWDNNDDRVPCRQLFEEFHNDYPDRVNMVEDCAAEELKGCIAGCRFFIGARTHSTIAAYSSLVPTLVVGYSVKARGIAKDLFGTEENYVLPVQALKNETDLTEAFKYIFNHEHSIQAQLATAMSEIRNREEEYRKIF